LDKEQAYLRLAEGCRVAAAAGSAPLPSWGDWSVSLYVGTPQVYYTAIYVYI
jgi:hypothetical protein